MAIKIDFNKIRKSSKTTFNMMETGGSSYNSRHPVYAKVTREMREREIEKKKRTEMFSSTRTILGGRFTIKNSESNKF